MNLGLVLLPQAWPGGAAAMGPTLRGLARAADDAGFASLWVVDHLLPPPEVGSLRDPMLEAYTTLGHLAAVTSRVSLGTLVTGVTQRHPGSLAKIVTTLDVLSGGRAWLGIGAACFEQEHRSLGVPFPPLRERFQRLEETLQIVTQMWSDDEAAYKGTHYRLDATINSPSPLSRPRILIGGSGMQVTLGLVARYADACSLFPDTLQRGLGALRRHCELVGRDYDEIEKTVYYRMNLGPDGCHVDRALQELAELADMGADTALCELKDLAVPGSIEQVGKRVIPAVAPL